MDFSFAQGYLFTYETKFKTDSLAEQHKITHYTLDIGKKEVKFYPTEVFKIKEIKKNPQEINTQYFLENLYQVNPLSIPEEQWYKLNLNYFLNPGKDYQGGTIYVQRPGDDKPVPVKLDSKQMIEANQKYLREHNNPIELNKAIQYPQ